MQLQEPGMLERLTRYWVYGGFLCGLLLFILLPELARHWSSAVLAVFVQLPVYMLHQYEEHDNDRFRLFVNRTIGGGHEVLSHAAVFVINVPGVWGIVAASFLLSAFVSIGYGLIAVYLVLVNAVTHLARRSRLGLTILARERRRSSSCLPGSGAFVRYSAPALSAGATICWVL